jgi:hypothetical protein
MRSKLVWGWAKVCWWFDNLKFGPWNAPNPLDLRTWRVRWPKP